MRGEVRGKAGEGVGQIDIVTVEESEVFTCGCPDARIPRAREAPVLLFQIDYFLPESEGHVACIVRRAVVHDYHLF